MEYTPGDFIVTHGGDIFDRLIQVLTMSRWNHAALITGTDGAILELTSSGIKRNAIQKYNSKDISIVHVPLSNEDRKQVLDYADFICVKHEKYGFLTILTILLKILTKSRLIVKLDGTLICSEFVANALAEGGYIWPKDMSLITPADLYRYFNGQSGLHLLPSE